MVMGIEDVICEVMMMSSGEESTEHGGLPPGFRFHPTDEELIAYYLASKVFHGTTFSSPLGLHIPHVDLNRCEPWDLPEVAKMGEREWYFFSLRDRKYPTGLRTNRATGAGYWKATGKDREIYSTCGSTANNSGPQLLGLKKTLVFYKGRAPRGQKTKWVMHEYRLLADADSSSHRHTCKEEWVMCRIFHKASGDKNKLPLLLQQRGESYTYLMEPSSLPTSTPASASLPPLLEPTTNTNNLSTLMSQPNTCDSLQTNPQNHLLIKTLINTTTSFHSQPNHQPFSPSTSLSSFQNQGTTTTSTDNKPIINGDTNTTNPLIRPHQDCSLWDLINSSSNSSTMQHWLDKIYPNPYHTQSLLFHNLDDSSPDAAAPPTSGHAFGFSPAADHHHHLHHDMSNRTASCFHMNMLHF